MKNKQEYFVAKYTKTTQEIYNPMAAKPMAINSRNITKKLLKTFLY